MEMILREEWVDSRLKYVGRVETVTVPNSKEIWIPDTFFATAEQVLLLLHLEFSFSLNSFYFATYKPMMNMQTKYIQLLTKNSKVTG